MSAIEVRPPAAERMRSWHWLLLDVVAWLLFAAIGAEGGEQPGLFFILLAVTAPVLARRRFPVTALLWTISVTYLFVIELAPGLEPGAWMLAAYSVAVRSRRSAVLVAAGSWLMAQSLAVMQDSLHLPSTFLVPLLVALPPPVIAETVRQRRTWMAAFAEQEQKRADTEAGIRMSAERLRIARELHDVVAHGVTLMTVQAGIARLRSDPADPMHEVVSTIEKTGRSSLTEMRRLMALLRGDDTDGLAPQPGLVDMGDLVASAASAGLRAEFSVHGVPRSLAAGADLACYRIVQEALTNVIKHAGTRSARIVITYEDGPHGGVRVRISNPPPGEGHAPYRVDQGGQGLPGMNERARLYGGHVRAAPTEAGGWLVNAWLPYADDEEPS